MTYLYSVTRLLVSERDPAISLPLEYTHHPTSTNVEWTHKECMLMYADEWLWVRRQWRDKAEWDWSLHFNLMATICKLAGSLLSTIAHTIQRWLQLTRPLGVILNNTKASVIMGKCSGKGGKNVLSSGCFKWHNSEPPTPSSLIQTYVVAALKKWN